MPVDKSADAPTVENQKDDPDSIYKVVTDIIALRHKYDDLKGNGELEFMYEEAKFRLHTREATSLCTSTPSVKVQ